MLDIKDYEEPTNNYTKLDNRLFDYFTSDEISIIWLFTRYRNLPKLNISNHFINKKLKISVNTIAKIINKFIKDGIITKTQLDNKNEFEITFYHSKIKAIISQGEDKIITNEETPQQPIKTQPDPQETQNNPIDDVLVYYKNKTDTKLCKDKTIIKNIKTILKDYTVEDLKRVTDYILCSEWHIKNKEIGLSVITRPTKFYEKLEKANSTNKKQPTTNKKPLNFI